MEILVRGGAAVVLIIVVLYALASIRSCLPGWGGGGGAGEPAPGPLGPVSGAPNRVVVTVETEQYSVDGTVLTLDQVLARVNASPADQQQVEIVQKPNAKFLSVKALHDRLNEKNIHPKTKKEY